PCLHFLLPPHPPPTFFPYTTLFRSSTDIPSVLGVRISIPFLPAAIVKGPNIGFAWRPPAAQFFADPPAFEGAETFEEKVPVYLQDRKSTCLNSSHVAISYAVFCLKK